jgi:adenylyltransferase/sulfurtransferase
MAKAEVASKKLRAINPHVSIAPYKMKLDSSNALELMENYDVVVDCTDNFPARYLINDSCVLLRKPDVYASVSRSEGLASVFYAGRGPCYRCLAPKPPPLDCVQECAEAGVLGVIPGIMGSIQAAETINLLTGNGRSLVGRIILFNALDMTFEELHVRRNPDCPVCGPRPRMRERARR